jgi:hypothetical protein
MRLPADLCRGCNARGGEAMKPYTKPTAKPVEPTTVLQTKS